MSEILILGMCKNNKSIYEVVGYLIDTRKFCKFELKDIFNKNKRAWDIGAITKVEGFQKISDYNIKVIGDCVLDRHLEKKELKEFLNSKKEDFMKFIKSPNIIFCVIKPKVIKKIYTIDNRYYIEIICEGIEKKIQIRDVRWVEYWNYIQNKKKDILDILKEKEEYYRNFLNDRDTYFIGYKEVIPDKNNNNRFKKKPLLFINIISVFWF